MLTRRHFLAGTGAIVASAVVPAVPATASAKIETSAIFGDCFFFTELNGNVWRYDTKLRLWSLLDRLNSVVNK